MNILLININFHHKNYIALNNYDVNITTINHTNLDCMNLESFDVVYSPSVPIDVNKYPNTKFIFGPHFSVFPDNKINKIKGDNSIYIQPSKWALDVWKYFSICKGLKLIDLPFGVDTIKFSPIKNISERNKILIYYKRRNPKELNLIKSFLDQIKIKYVIFDYVKKYPEEEYINFLKEAKFGIWLTAHESQGFALEEALSCDVPLLVWNVTLLNQEYGSNYPNLPATTIPYWDERCGESFTNSSELSNIFTVFINNLENYRPREFILENLSSKICSDKFINVANNIY